MKRSEADKQVPDLFSMILWTMSSVVRLFPLSIVLNMPLFLGSYRKKTNDYIKLLGGQRFPVIPHKWNN